LWIDNSQNNQQVSILNQQSGQNIIVPAGFQGTVPIFAPNPPVFNVSSTGNGEVDFIFLNVPVISMNLNTSGSNFKFDGNGYLEVDDVTLNTLMASVASGAGQLNVAEYVATNADIVQPRFVGSQLYNGNAAVTAVQTIIAGAPNFFFTFAEILITPDAYIASAGEFTVTLKDSGTGNTLATGVCYLPAAAPTISQASPPVLLCLLEDLEYIGRHAAGGNLTLTLGAALTAGEVFWNVAGGTTAKIGA
ncbi:MAG: DUF1859 domain-containing protein, partial [Limisphaerales bacterium]